MLCIGCDFASVIEAHTIAGQPVFNFAGGEDAANVATLIKQPVARFDV
jgi:hypothetical protein